MAVVGVEFAGGAVVGVAVVGTAVDGEAVVADASVDGGAVPAAGGLVIAGAPLVVGVGVVELVLGALVGGEVVFDDVVSPLPSVSTVAGDVEADPPFGACAATVALVTPDPPGVFGFDPDAWDVDAGTEAELAVAGTAVTLDEWIARVASLAGPDTTTNSSTVSTW